MRKLLFAIIIALLFTNSYAQAYKVFNTTGMVYTYDVSDQLIKVYKGLELSLNTKFYLSNNASLQIVETKTSRIFTSQRLGQMTVRDIVVECKSNELSKISQINSLVANNKHVEPKIHWHTVGGTRKGNANGLYEAAIMSNLQSCYNREKLCKQFKDDNLKAKRIKKGKGLYSYIVENKSSDSLYVNIAIFNKIIGQVVDFGFVIDKNEPIKEWLTFMLPPNSSFDFENFIFAEDKMFEHMLFAVSKPFAYDTFFSAKPDSGEIMFKQGVIK